MKPDFSKIEYHQLPDPSFNREQEKSSWLTSEQIPVKGLFASKDSENFIYNDFPAGSPPFLRGPYASMYLGKPWTIRQYAGFSTAEESNAFYRRNLDNRASSTRKLTYGKAYAFLINNILFLINATKYS